MTKYSDILANFRDQSGCRLTSPRKRILNAICTYNGHFRAEDLAKRILLLGKPVSLVTVYRNIPVLERAGVIRRTCITGDVSWYERTWQRDHHDHLICTRCDKVIEFKYPAIDILQEAVAFEYGFLLTGHHLELMGECRDCQSNRKNKTKGGAPGKSRRR